MKTLAFDTSTKYLSVALFEGDIPRAEFHKEAGIRHSEILMPTVAELMRHVSWKVGDINLISVGIGPGSFTGLRIAVSAAKALALVLGCKVVGVPTMDAMAADFAVKREGLIAPLLDARKGRVYSCIYDVKNSRVRRVTEYFLVTVKDLLEKLPGKVEFFGDAVVKYGDALKGCPSVGGIYEGDDWYPKALYIGKLGMERQSTAAVDPEALEPMYLYAKECSIVIC